MRSRFLFLEREREPLLSRFTGYRTVEILRTKKESCSTQRGLRVDSGFRKFRQTPRGRGFILLGFYTLFKCYRCFGWYEVLNGRLIGPKT